MSEKEKYPSELAERFQIRLPAGLRDRIKAYAERHGRSMNTEIVRVLEREFPPSWTIAGRVGQMIDMLRVLKAGVNDEHVEALALELQDTVEGIMTGRVQGVDAEMRERIGHMYKDMLEREAEDAADLHTMEYDDEELSVMDVVGRSEKYAEAPPEKLNSFGNNAFLMDILPPKVLAELTKRLSELDIDGASAVLNRLTRDDLLRRNRDKHPDREHPARRENMQEDPPTDPFATGN